MKKIVIVAPELAGLFKNGGIGTNLFNRSRFLSRHLNYQVTLLYTGACTPDEAQAWRERHGQPGIRLELLPPQPAGTDWKAILRRATAVHEWLAPQAWDEIHLPEYLANGFVCIQAKRAGLAYQNTRLVVSMHSSSLWCREIMQQWSPDPETDAKLDYAEQYCCENADTLVSPSRYLVDWAERKGWRLPADRFQLPSLHETPVPATLPPAPLRPRHLIFFGRLETRKGLGIFCDAVQRLVAADQAPQRVDFLGRIGTHEGRGADHYLRKMTAQWPAVETHLLTELDSFAAMEHIRRTGGVAVIASPADNFPNTVIECIVNQVPFIATNASGLAEMADPRVLFAPDARALAAKLADLATLPPSARLNHPYSPENSRQAWKTFAETPFASRPWPPAVPAPRISVCLPHYNHGRHLPETLASLARQTYENFEVIVVDDGSTEAGSVEQFDRMQKTYPQFRFVRQANVGVGAARNFAAAQATGELLVFVDADNVAKPTMLAVFARALQVSGADCATCQFDLFHEPADLQKPPGDTCRPLGPCLEAGWRMNIFGDANFVVKKTVFMELGGFATDRSAVEDWQFLIRLAFKGLRQIVIPESLYWYRFLPDSMMRTTDELRFSRTILETYREGLTSWPARIIENHVFGPHLGAISGHTVTIHSHASPGSRNAAGPSREHGKFVKKLQKSCVKRLLELAGAISRL